MKMILAILMLLSGCVEPFDDYSVDKGAAGAPSITVRKVEPGVGLWAGYLTACEAAKTKAQGRHHCVAPWQELESELRNTSGTCGNANDYLIFKTSQQPSDTSVVRFEVDWRNHGEPGWRLSEYIECGCNDSGPCVVVPEYGDIGSGAGIQAAAATCSNASYCAKQKAFVNSASHTTWAWSGACAPNNTWFGTAPGGRTGTASADSDIKHRRFALSQSFTGIVHCTCPSTNNPSCGF